MTTASSNTTRPLPDQRVPIIDRYRRWTPTWWKWIKPLLESVDENSANIVTVTATANNAAAAITTEQTVRADADAALASQITTIEAAYQAADAALSAAVTNEASARASADAAIASQITTVQAAYQAADATISAAVTTEATARASADGTLASYYTIYTNANGRVTGAVQLSSVTAAGSASPSLSTFAVLADKFIIVHPSSNGTTMQAFVVGSVNGVSTVGINGNLLVDGTIVANAIAAGAVTAAKLNVGTLSAITANLGTVTAGRIQNASGTSYWDLSTGVFQITS